MADITKCKNEQCPLSWNCWRFNAPSNSNMVVHQSYDRFEPDEEGNCEMYWDMDEMKNKYDSPEKTTPQ